MIPHNKTFFVWLGGVYGLLIGLVIAIIAQIIFIKLKFGPIKSVTLISLAGIMSALGSHSVSRYLFHNNTPIFTSPAHYFIFFSVLPVLVLILIIVLLFSPN
jgi:hypothetical protein